MFPNKTKQNGGTSSTRKKIPWYEYKQCYIEKHITRDQKDFIQRLGLSIYDDVSSQRKFFDAIDALSDEEIKKILKTIDIPLYDLCHNVPDTYLTKQELEWKAYINEEWLVFEDFLP